MTKPSTIRELRNSGYASRTVKQELRDNLIARIRRGEGLFTGIVGYEQTVVPQIENAVLSGQDIVFLGERGQAKTRMARLLVGLLDAEMPALAGWGAARSRSRRSARRAASGWPSRARGPLSRGSRATGATGRSSPPPTSPSPTCYVRRG